MASGITIGYVNFTIFLLVLTGILILRIDVKVYRAENQDREYKTSRFIGWFNIVGGSVTYAGYWLYQNYLM